MKGRGKDFSKLNFTGASEEPCNKHPLLSSVGICPFCLKERLLKLVCSECGEQRHSSCSCSSLEVGRMSFLIENNVNDSQMRNTSSSVKSRKIEDKSKQVTGLRRSSSSCMKVNEHKGLWLKLLRNKGIAKDEVKSEVWVSDTVDAVSSSRSLCSFRSEDDTRYSAKISDVTNDIFIGPGKQRLLFTTEYDSELPKRTTVLKNDLAITDDSDFFDISFDFSDDPKQEPSTSDREFSVKAENVGNNKRCNSRSKRVWKWIFKYRRSVNKEGF